MENYKISNFIKTLRIEKKYTVADLANKCDIGIRGFSKWLKKTDREWSTDSLIILSKILDFKIIIDEGEIKLMKKNERVNVLERDEREVYSVYKDFGEYSIVNLYTPNSNLSDDETPELLEDFFIFSSEAKCKKEFPENNPVKVYGLLNNTTNYVELERLISIYPYRAEAHYYFNLAPTISLTEDGYEIVDEFEDCGMKLARAGAILEKDSMNNEYYVEAFSNNFRKEEYLPGFVLMPINSNSSEDFIEWTNDFKYLYLNYKPFKNRNITRRHFDKNRNEIVNGDIIVKKCSTRCDEADIHNDDCDRFDMENYFKKHESLRIEKLGGILVFDKGRGLCETLDKLNLLNWERVNYEDEENE